MPTFDFTAPDGKSYSVDGPAGSTPEQAFQILQEHLGNPAPAPQDSGGGSSLLGTAKSLGTGLAQGAIGLAGLPADIAHLYAPNQSDPNPLGSEGLQKKVEQYTGDFYKPQGAIEDLASKIGQFAPAAIGGPESLGARIAQRAVVPALTSEVAKQATAGTSLEPYAEAAGGLAGAVAAPLAVQKFQNMVAASKAAKAIPSGMDLVQKGSDQFNQARNMDVAVKPAFAANTAQEMRDAVKDFDPEQIKPVLNAIGRLDDLYQPTAPNLYNTLQPVKPTPPIDMNDVENVRKQLSSLRTSIDPTLRTAAKAAQEVITKNQMALTAADAVRGDAPLYAQTLRDAVGNYAAGKRSAAVTGKLDLANLNAETAGSGANVDNAMRQAIKQLARPMNNTNVPVARKLGFNDQEIDAINTAARGTTFGNAARYIGKGAPTGIVSAAGGLGVGHMAGGPAGAIAVPTIGYVAKKVGDLSTANAVRRLDQLVRSRSPEAQKQAVALAAQMPPQLVRMLPKQSAALLAAMSTDPLLIQGQGQQANAPVYQLR